MRRPSHAGAPLAKKSFRSILRRHDCREQALHFKVCPLNISVCDGRIIQSAERSTFFRWICLLVLRTCQRLQKMQSFWYERLRLSFNSVKSYGNEHDLEYLMTYQYVRDRSVPFNPRIWPCWVLYGYRSFSNPSEQKRTWTIQSLFRVDRTPVGRECAGQRVIYRFT